MATDLDALRRAQDRDLERRDDLAIVRERLQAPRRARPARVLVPVAAAAVVLAALLLARPFSAPAVATYVSSHGVPLGAWLVVPAGSEERLAFADGSVVRAHEGARVRVESVSEHGADIGIEVGRATVAVVHREGAAWRLHLGPYEVRVTGTRFDVSFVDHVLAIAMEDGTVVVTGPGIDGTRAVVGGQRFEVREPGTESPSVPSVPVVAATVVAAPSSDLPPPPAPRVAGPVAREAVPAPEVVPPPAEPIVPAYRAVARAGDFEAVMAMPEVAEMDPDQADVSPDDLLLLGDAARTTHRAARARAFYQALRHRFAEHDEARTATYGLGLLAFEADDAALAASWMRTYLLEAPDGPLAGEARGRLLEALVASHDDAAARAAARDYLARDPHGPHAALAAHVLSTERE